MGGAKSKTTNATTNNQTNLNTGIHGDNSGLVVAGVEGSTITQTDHDAVKSAFDANAAAIESASGIAEESIDANTRNLQNSLNSMLGAVTSSNNVLNDSVKQANQTAQKALGVAQDAKSRQLTGDSVDLAGASKWCAVAVGVAAVAAVAVVGGRLCTK